MTKLYQRYLGFLYIKSFFIIFFSLVFFYVGVDLLTNLGKLPNSANLQFIYAGFTALVAMSYALPLGLVFALISTKVMLIRSNELISLYTSGISRTQVAMPFFIVSLVATLIFVGLNFTNFAKASEYKHNLIHNNVIATSSENIFVKYEDSYIYFKNLNPIKKEATGIKIFETDDIVLDKIIEAKRGVFDKKSWTFFDVKITTIAKEKFFSGRGLIVETKKKFKALQNFKPVIIDSMQEGKIALTIPEAKEALSFLSAQGAHLDGIKSNFFSMLFFPFFAPFMSMILFYYFPPIGRFANLAIFTSLSIFATLCIWGIVFVLGRFSASSVMPPEFGIILPVVLLGLYALYLFGRKR